MSWLPMEVLMVVVDFLFAGVQIVWIVQNEAADDLLLAEAVVEVADLLSVGVPGVRFVRTEAVEAVVEVADLRSVRVQGVRLARTGSADYLFFVEALVEIVALLLVWVPRVWVVRAEAADAL